MTVFLTASAINKEIDRLTGELRKLKGLPAPAGEELAEQVIGGSRKKYRFLNLRQGHREISRLRAEIRKAASEHSASAPEVADMKPAAISKPPARLPSTKTLGAPATSKTGSVAVKLETQAGAPVHSPSAMSRRTLARLAALFPVISTDASVTDADLFAAVQQSASEANLTIPGMSTPGEAQPVQGLARTLRAMRQERIDQILKDAGAVAAPQSCPQPVAGDKVQAGTAALTPAPWLASGVGRAQLLQLAEVFTLGNVESLSDAQLWAKVERVAFMAHVSVPGARTAFDFERPRLFGMARLEAKTKQARVNDIFKVS